MHPRLKMMVSLLLIQGLLWGNPDGEQVVAGGATFDRSGNQLTINQSTSQVVIQWNGFSIGAGEVTRFVQPSSDSMALNRVMGGDPSQIYGTLRSNGQVLVINPNGIIVGSGGRIETGGFVASTLNLTNEAFLAKGDWNFTGNSTASIVNDGTISAIGGDVFLFAQKVENRGTISAPNGTVGLAAGTDLFLAQSGEERILVRSGVSGTGGTGVLNSGTIAAAAAELKAAGGNVYALAINNTGLIEATGSVKRSGRVLLASVGGKIENRGTITAKNADGNGGAIKLESSRDASGKAAEVANYGTIQASGTAPETKGGSIQVLGDYVGIYDGILEANGPAGGGEILVGGDKLGQNPTVMNAIATYLAAEARISANATENGNGGKVILFANDVGRFRGQVTARGGVFGGNGGFIETSGKRFFEVGKVPDVGAPAGKGGLWLIDPFNITIVAGTVLTDITASSPFDSTGDNAQLGATNITSALANGNVEVVTGAGGSQEGDITVNEEVQWYEAHTLTLKAHHSIIINQKLDNSDGEGGGGGGAIKLFAGANVEVNAEVLSNNGTIEIEAQSLFGSGNISTAFTFTPISGSSSDDAELSELLDDLGISESDLLAILNPDSDFSGTETEMGAEGTEGDEGGTDAGANGPGGTGEGTPGSEKESQELKPGDSVQLGGGDNAGPPPPELAQGLTPEVRGELSDALK